MSGRNKCNLENLQETWDQETKPKSMTRRVWEGTLQTSLQMLFGLHVSVEVNESVGDTNDFLTVLKGKRVRIVIEEVTDGSKADHCGEH